MPFVPLPARDVLRGLWGGFQASALARESTADVWDRLRSNAQAYADNLMHFTGLSGITGADVLGHVSASDVSRMRGIAGEWASARAHLHSIDRNVQIGPESIFDYGRLTGNYPRPGQERWRVRANISYAVKGQAGQVTEWRTYELSGPPTTVDSLLRWATNATMSRYKQVSQVTGVNDFELERY